MAETKGADEMYCRSCGEVIKKKAEICPECGVRNEHGENPSGSSRSRSSRSRSSPSGSSGASTSSSTSSPSASTKPHDPADYTTTVSENWYYVVAGSTVAWLLTFVATSAVPSGSAIGGLFGLLALLAWVGMPIGFYFDAKYVRANGEWNPETGLWAIGGIVPLVNVVAGAVYLYRRHEVLGVP